MSVAVECHSSHGGHEDGMKTQSPYYPLHESVRDILHPDYVKFYNQHLIHRPPSHQIPISVARSSSGVPTGRPPLPVAAIEDIHIPRRHTEGPDIRLRYFYPEGVRPTNGWPVMIYYHGGGWVLGDIDSENNICTQLCARSQCVVITPEYRLAPEHPYPAAIHDSWETLLWTATEGASLLHLDAGKIAAGGPSAGANLAAAVVNRTMSSAIDISLVAQLLVVPVLNNTATPANNPSWKRLQHTSTLSAEKMLWYRNHYLPEPLDRSHPDASPTFFFYEISEQPTSTTVDVVPTKMPATLIVIGGADILSHEALEYAANLEQYCSVKPDVHVIEGMPHPFVSMDAILEGGRTAITLMCQTLSRAFDSTVTTTTTAEATTEMRAPHAPSHTASNISHTPDTSGHPM